MPSWFGAYTGKWFGAWFGAAEAAPPTTAETTTVATSLYASTPTVTTGAVALVATVTLALTAVQPVVQAAAVATPQACDLTVDTQQPSCLLGATVAISTTQLTLTCVAPAISTGAVVTADAVVLTSDVLTPTTSTGARAVATEYTLSLTSTPPLVVTGAVGTTEHLVLDISSDGVTVVTGAVVPVTALELTLAVPEFRVYDVRGAILYLEPVVMRINIPEILSYSTDITTDMLVVEAMETDLASVDGTQQVQLVRKTDNVVVDITKGTAIPENKVYTFNNTLIRMVSERDNRSVRQLRLFMQAVQNDELPTIDTIIELPRRDDVEIRTGDQIHADMLQTKYSVIAIDDCTLKTRWRLGARKLV